MNPTKIQIVITPNGGRLYCEGNICVAVDFLQEGENRRLTSNGVTVADFFKTCGNWAEHENLGECYTP